MKQRFALALTALLLLASCRNEAKRALQKVEPQTAATVVTMQTTIQPANRTYTHTIVFTSDHARIGSEVDQWRLFDLGRNAVTFVDDIERTYRTEAVPDLLRVRRAAMSAPADAAETLPRATVTRTGVHRNVAGADTEQYLVRMGGYRRELWIASSSPVPPQLFAMMQASDVAPAVPAMMRAADEALLAIGGFPFADHTELPFDTNKRMVVDRTVLKVEKKNVPRSWLNVAGNYRELPPALTAPAARPQPGASPRRDRNTRGEGSRSSATDRKTP